MQHGYRKSNYCKRIIRRFVVKCGQIKKIKCESKWKIPVELWYIYMHSSGINPLAVGLSPYKIAKIDAFASKLAGRLFSPFCMARSVHKIISTHLLILQITNLWYDSYSISERNRKEVINGVWYHRASADQTRIKGVHTWISKTISHGATVSVQDTRSE